MLQLVTFNIGGARKLRQPPHDPLRLGADAAETLRRLIDPTQPTFIALQETGWIEWAASGRRDAAHEAFAASLGAGYRAYFAPELTSATHPHPRLWGRDAYAGMRAAAEGNGFVTNLPFTPWDWAGDQVNDCWAHTQISAAALYSTGNRDTQPRNLMVASVAHPTFGALYVLNTHYGTLSGEDRHDATHPRTQEGAARRRSQSEQVLRVVRELRTSEETHNKPARPIILAGDFNAIPPAPSMQDLREVFTLLPVDNDTADCWTHATHKILIDHIFVSDPRGVLPAATCSIQVDAPFDDLTDHRAVVARFGG